MTTPRRRIILMRKMGENLKAIRITKGAATAEDFAEHMKLHPARYRKYERGEAVPPPDVLEMLHDALGVDLNWLLLGRPRRDELPAGSMPVISPTDGSPALAVEPPLAAAKPRHRVAAITRAIDAP